MYVYPGEISSINSYTSVTTVDITKFIAGSTFFF